jgi:hypothetical protein
LTFDIVFLFCLVNFFVKCFGDTVLLFGFMGIYHCSPTLCFRDYR